MPEHETPEQEAPEHEAPEQEVGEACVDAPREGASSARGAERAVAVLEAAVVVVGGRRVLGPVDLRIGAGEHWALLGPNGSGKTTLLSLLGAQRQPSGGAAWVLGSRLGTTDLRRLRARVGIVSHSVADRLPPAASAAEVVLTGRDGLLAPWWGRFGAAEHEAARRLLARLGCVALADQAFGSCSQGERQRVLIARSLYAEPPLLLLDEPAGGVDLPGREALVAALDGLAAGPGGPATVQVAHTLEELPASTSHALLLRAGHPVACGPAGDVLADGPLSACFGAPFSVERRPGGRYAAWVPGSW